jgi:hypothetical protein
MRVCLTSDIWSNNSREDYLSMVFHFVTNDWELDKHIISMRLIDYAHTGVNIVERVLQVIFQFDMISKGFSITLDNAFANASAMTDLLSYVFGSANASGLLHQLCAYHIINLIVKSGMKRIKRET